MDSTSGYSGQYWFNDPPEDWDVPPRVFRTMEGIRQMGLTGKWIYEHELRELLLRFNPTKSKDGWETLRGDFSTFRGTDWRTIARVQPEILKLKSGLVRRAREQDPSLPLKSNLIKFEGTPTKGKILEVLTSLKFTLGAHGLTIEKYPLERFPKQYAAVVVSDELAAQRYVETYNNEQQNLKLQHRLPTIWLVLDKTPEEPILKRKEYLALLSKDPPNVEGISTSSRERKISQLSEQVEELKKLMASADQDRSSWSSAEE